MLFPFDGLSDVQSKRLLELFDCRMKTILVVCGVFSFTHDIPLIHLPDLERPVRRSSPKLMEKDGERFQVDSQASGIGDPVSQVPAGADQLVRSDEEALR